MVAKPIFAELKVEKSHEEAIKVTCFSLSTLVCLIKMYLLDISESDLIVNFNGQAPPLNISYTSVAIPVVSSTLVSGWNTVNKTFDAVIIIGCCI